MTCKCKPLSKKLKASNIEDSCKLSKSMYVSGIYQEIKEALNNSDIGLSLGQAEVAASLLSNILGSTRLERI